MKINDRVSAGDGRSRHVGAERTAETEHVASWRLRRRWLAWKTRGQRPSHASMTIVFSVDICTATPAALKHTKQRGNAVRRLQGISRLVLLCVLVLIDERSHRRRARQKRRRQRRRLSRGKRRFAPEQPTDRRTEGVSSETERGDGSGQLETQGAPSCPAPPPPQPRHCLPH